MTETFPAYIIEAARHGAACSYHPDRAAFAWCPSCGTLQCNACTFIGFCVGCKLAIRTLGAIAKSIRKGP